MALLESSAELDYKMMLKELRHGIRLFRECQQCRGDIYFDTDNWGSYFSCMQAGHMIEVDTPRGKELTLLAYRNQVSRKAT